MTWTAYRIVLRLKSPLHVGQLTIGNLQQARPYVPGKTLWGALVARLTRDFSYSRDDYQAMGERVNRELAFSYFYPALDPDQPLYPAYTTKGLHYGPNEMPPDEFAWHLLSSYASTAVDAGRTAAAEGSLHETEFISPYARDKDDDHRPVYLVGYVFEQMGSALRWKEVLNRLQLGGERKYGWGRVTLENKLEPENDAFGRSLVLTGDRPTITVPENGPLLAHTIADGLDARGRIEPFLGRETKDANQFGNAPMPKAQICWVPGSQIVDVDGRQFKVDSYGTWVAITSES